MTPASPTNLRRPRGYMHPMTDLTRFRRAALALLAAASLSGCAVFATPPPLTPDRAYQQGMEAYQAGRYARAAELLGQFIPAAGADPRLQEALMTLARAQMETGQYVSAAAAYLRVATQFPTAPEAVDARFGMCDAYHQLSPRPQLDQQYTHGAIAHCQSFAANYPDHARAAQAREWVAELRGTLGEKAYLNGFFYFRRGLYDAAVMYFQRVVADYPETAAAPKALMRMVESYDRMGYREEEEAARERLLREYPQSAEARGLAPAETADG